MVAIFLTIGVEGFLFWAKLALLENIEHPGIILELSFLRLKFLTSFLDKGMPWVLVMVFPELRAFVIAGNSVVFDFEVLCWPPPFFPKDTTDSSSAAWFPGPQIVTNLDFCKDEDPFLWGASAPGAAAGPLPPFFRFYGTTFFNFGKVDFF